MAVAGDRRRSRTLRIWVRRQPGLETRIFTNSPSFLGTVCHRGFGETTTDICRYRSGGARLHYRLTGVIRRFGDYTAKWFSRATTAGAKDRNDTTQTSATEFCN